MLRWKNYIALFCGNIIHTKISYILEKTLVFSFSFFFLICSKCKNENEKIFKEEESIEVLKILGLIENI